MEKHKPFLDMCMLLEELVSSYELDTTLDILARNLVEQMGVKGCTIRLLDEKTRTLQIVAAHGLSKAYLEKRPVLLEEHPIDKKVISGECISTKDIMKEPHLLYLEEAKKEGIKSVMSCPLTVQEKAIGVIRIYTSEFHDFTEDEIQRLRVLSSLGGIMFDRARIWKQMQTLIDRECMEGRAVIVSDVSKDSRLQYPEEIIKEGIRAILSVPLSIRGTVMGVLRVYTTNPYSFTPIEINFISALASSGAIAIENARLFEHIKDEYEELTRDVWKWYDWGK